MYEINAICHTEAGDVRNINQDSIFAETETVGKNTVGMFIVADGCGGMSQGGEISKLAVNYFDRLWREHIATQLKSCPVRKEKDVVNTILEDAINKINSMAIKHGSDIGAKVGSTLSLVLTVNNRYYIKNLGDSRVYLIRKNTVYRLTEDQSLVAEMLRNKKLTPDEAKMFKRKNVLTMCLGYYNEAKSFSASGKIRNGDVLVLCSDGFYNCVDEATMAASLNRYGVTSEAVVEMRSTIPYGDARDNLSVIICQYEKKQKWFLGA